MGRRPCCDKANVKKGPWTPEEDAKLLGYASNNGTGNWTSFPQRAGLKRCRKSCMLRYNYLRPNLEKESFTQEEDLIVTLHAMLGNRCLSNYSSPIITMQLAGGFVFVNFGSRSQCSRRLSRQLNFISVTIVTLHAMLGNTKLSKKLRQRGICPITHRPIADLLKSIGTLPIRAPPTTGADAEGVSSSVTPLHTVASRTGPAAAAGKRACTKNFRAFGPCKEAT